MGSWLRHVREKFRAEVTKFTLSLHFSKTSVYCGSACELVLIEVCVVYKCLCWTMTKKLWEAADRGVYKRSCGTYPDYEKGSWRSERQLIEVLFTSTRVEPTPMTKQTDALSGSYRWVVIHVCVVWWYLVHLSFCTVVSSYRDFIIYGWTEQDAERQRYY